jgi:hypothetical protein
MECIRSPRLRKPSWTTALGVVLAAAGVLMGGLSGASAAEPQTRTFSITVDGKKAGEYSMVIEKQPDGTAVLLAKSNVRVTVLAIPVYTYSYEGKEVWKDGRLTHFESWGKEKGTAFHIRADADSSALHVVANSKEHTASLDVWTTSCWQLPPAKFRDNAIVMFGCDTGSDFGTRLQLVGSEKISVAGQEMSCTHYRVTKDVSHDLWYDAQERLVRDEWVSGGHRTVLEMTEMH